MSSVQYFVLNDNTLCYQREGNAFYGVLAGSVIRGGLDPLSGMHVRLDSDRVRQATLQDFSDYRVMVPKAFREPVEPPPATIRPPLAIRRSYATPYGQIQVAVIGGGTLLPMHGCRRTRHLSRARVALVLRAARRDRRHAAVLI